MYRAKVLIKTSKNQTLVIYSTISGRHTRPEKKPDSKSIGDEHALSSDVITCTLKCTQKN